MVPKSRKTLKFLTWNIHGARDRINEVIHFNKRPNKNDVICLQEPYTSSTKNKTPPKIPGYHSYSSTGRTGLLTYVKYSVPHEFVKHTSQSDDVQYHHLRINTTQGFLSIYNVYVRPNQISDTLLPKLCGDGILCMGDFNSRHTDLGDFRRNNNGYTLKNYIVKNDLTIYDTDTQTHLSGGRLDLILGRNLVHNNVKTNLITELVSDHFAIATEYSFPVKPQQPYKRTRISIPDNFEHHFKAHVGNWYSTYTPMSVDEFYNDLVQVITSYYETWIKLKRKRANSRHNSPTWVEDTYLAEEQDKVRTLGDVYKNNKTYENLLTFLTANRELRKLKDEVRNTYWEDFLQSINRTTSSSEMWAKIKRISGNSPPPPLHHSPAEYADMLLDQWSSTSQVTSLPANIQTYLHNTKVNRQFNIEIACASIDPTDHYQITEYELHSALQKGKSTAPGEDGITYNVLRLLGEIPSNPLLQLYRMSLSQGVLPQKWTESLIIPIPKSNSQKFRPISLTSCMCKVLERIVLNRLMFRLEGMLSPNIYGFMPECSTQHCFAESFAHTNKGTQTAFIDLQSAFDTANREVILEQLSKFGIHGKLISWIRGYLSNRSASVLFHGVKSGNTRTFELGTPQGGVLSPMLFNVLMHTLISNLPLQRDEALICYADDICLKTTSKLRLQSLLTALTQKCIECGLIMSVEKTQILNRHKTQPFPFTINNTVLKTCESYRYLGIETNDPKYISSLRERLYSRLKPLRVLTGKTFGLNVKLARTFYLAFIRSIIDYHALHLAGYTEKAIKPLETVQNEAMRLILGCGGSTRIVNMRLELNLPSIYERIVLINTMFGVSVLRHNGPARKSEHNLRAQLANPQYVPHPTVESECRHRLNLITSQINKLNVPINKKNIVTPIPPWEDIIVPLNFTNIPKKGDLTNAEMKCITLENINQHIEQLNSNEFCAYTDGSLLTDLGRAGCACVVYHGSQKVHSMSHRLHNWASTTQAELAGIYNATEYLKENAGGIIFCDSKSALQALNSPKNACPQLVADIKRNVIHATSTGKRIQFVWIPSHVGITNHDVADKLANQACRNENIDIDYGIPLTTIRHIQINMMSEALHLQRNSQRPASCSIKHYDNYCNTKHTYGKYKHRTRQCDIVIARIRLGYRYLWQVAKEDPLPKHSNCRLCESPLKHTLEHYITECEVVKDFRPPGMRYSELCEYYIESGIIEDILELYPKFASPY